jgi:restriction system protein
MAVPDFQTVMLPMLRITEDRAEHTTGEVIEQLANEFALSSEDRQELLPSGTQRRFDNRVNWAAAHLRKAGLLESAGRGRFRITDRGMAVLHASPPKVDMKLLAQFPEYLQFIRGGGDSKSQASVVQATGLDQTPEELIDVTFRQLEEGLAQQLLDTVASLSPTFFEQLVVDLLLKMGYGGSSGAGRRIGRAGDGGIDGTIDQDPLGLDVVYIQAKRWQASVGRPVLQAFAGSLEGNKATKGLIITTSSFSPDAITYVGTIPKRIVLIDGHLLARLMIRHGLGVKSTETYVMKQVDSDYFAPGEIAATDQTASAPNVSDG